MNTSWEARIEHVGYGRRIMVSLIDGALVGIAYVAMFVAAKGGLLFAGGLAKGAAQAESLAGALMYVLLLAALVIDMVVFVLMPKFAGATPGQLLTNTRLVMRDSTKPSYNAIMLKHCASFILLVITMWHLWAYALFPRGEDGTQAIQAIVIACYGWLFLNLFVMACNARHLSIADYIADTALVDKASVKEGYVYIYAEDGVNAIPVRFMDAGTSSGGTGTDGDTPGNGENTGNSNDQDDRER